MLHGSVMYTVSLELIDGLFIFLQANTRLKQKNLSWTFCMGLFRNIQRSQQNLGNIPK